MCDGLQQVMIDNILHPMRGEFPASSGEELQHRWDAQTSRYSILFTTNTNSKNSSTCFATLFPSELNISLSAFFQTLIIGADTRTPTTTCEEA
jgi:hypothetical protein